ncbi:helix-turn-helix domain-containing protein [Curtobacterium sp. VKM Ac-1376]|uniref:helix-turn-helix domain-containing protein n=1 Tax=Curtobacterium sp. VKM Ac-1376 TaxID=123312 RepID=UPI00188D4F65|nr:helix-turn-helix transcriptional regulator [Curtobacterium sp. VKM Ac-1376]MBF4616440.1 helix-turn-helix domain-containing protein [Curtobacterium sp. VKM Ac-1376]
MSDLHREFGEFLRRARANRDPQDTGLLPDGRTRRVPGLRREEVALLAGVSTDYYTRLEQGRHLTPSAQVVDALARALDLDEASHTYLRTLNASAGAPRSVIRPAAQRVRPGLRQLLDSLSSHPALILGNRTDVLASTALARALFTDFEAMPAKRRNYARWLLLDEHARDLFLDWEEQARNAVEALRLDAAANPDDAGTQQLIGELSLSSADFRQWWTAQRVHQRTFGTKRLHHPVVGPLEVQYETLTLPADPKQVLYVYTTEPSSPSSQALALLASWTHPGLTEVVLPGDSNESS